MILIDFHPAPKKALCDGPQALTPDRLPKLVRYVERVRAAYEEVAELSGATLVPGS